MVRISADSDEICTARLHLRRARMGDLAAMHRVFSDPQTMRYWSTPPHVGVDDTRTWLSAMVNADPNICDDFVVEYAGEVIGKAGFWRIPEIGFILRRDCWGRGLAREALDALISRRFAKTPDAILVADVDPRNTASLRLLTGLGFAETHRAVRTWNVDGVWVDSVYLALEKARARTHTTAD